METLRAEQVELLWDIKEKAFEFLSWNATDIKTKLFSEAIVGRVNAVLVAYGLDPTIHIRGETGRRTGEWGIQVAVEKQLPAYREERVIALLEDFACNHEDYDIYKVAAELRSFLSEQLAEERRKEVAAR